MQKFLAAALGVVIALGALAATSAQQSPPHGFYGSGLTAGDTVALLEAHDDHYDTVGEATADENGGWSINVSGDGDTSELSWTVNGEAAAATYTDRGETLTEVTLTVAMMDEDGMMDDEDGMMDDDEGMMDDGDTAYPATGSGGLADGGVSAGLIGLLIALAAVSVAGLGLRRIRNRA